MILHWKLMIVTNVLVLFGALLADSQEYSPDVRSLCPGVCAVRRPPTNAAGLWWTVLASNSSIGECGTLNNQYPCKCLGYKITTRSCPPYITEYNVTSFGYNTQRCCYEQQLQDIYLIDKNDEWLVVGVTYKDTGATLIGSVLDTDCFKSFLVFYACSARTANGDPFINVISRDIRGLTPKNRRRVEAALRANNICPEKLIEVNRRNCPRYLC
uniref:Lipocalin/cytosolic fatty-acid binding domain-containing protein n=1 Tax=Homalodisca liturata TaxID=320908 RepID=A0A1B6H6V8_9HEMI